MEVKARTAQTASHSPPCIHPKTNKKSRNEESFSCFFLLPPSVHLPYNCPSASPRASPSQLRIQPRRGQSHLAASHPSAVINSSSPLPPPPGPVPPPCRLGPRPRPWAAQARDGSGSRQHPQARATPASSAFLAGASVSEPRRRFPSLSPAITCTVTALTSKSAAVYC